MESRAMRPSRCACCAVVPARVQEQLSLALCRLRRADFSQNAQRSTSRGNRWHCISSTAGLPARTSRWATASASCAATRRRSPRLCAVPSKRDIRHIEQAENIAIPKKDISEPVFHHGQGHTRYRASGNTEMCVATASPRPQGGAGGAWLAGQRQRRGRGRLHLHPCPRKSSCSCSLKTGSAAPAAHPPWRHPFEYKRRAGYKRWHAANNLAVLRTMRGV